MGSNIKITNELEEYINNHSYKLNPIQIEIIEYNKTLGEKKKLQISLSQCHLLHLIIKLYNPKKILEIGTFTGLSALTMGLAMNNDSNLIAIDKNKQTSEMAKNFFIKANLENKINLLVKNAIDGLDELIKSKEVFDTDDHRAAVADRVAAIKRELDATDSDYDREKLNERIAKLAGGVAVIKVGAPTETELKNRKLRIEDALNATRAAIEEGIVPGGGTTLLQLADGLNGLVEQLEGDQRTGVEILQRALVAPVHHIATNAGHNGDVVIEAMRNSGQGFNALTGTYEDLMAADIVDAAKVVRLAVQDAVSIASLLITTEVVIADKPESEAPPADGGGDPMGGMGGMGGMGMPGMGGMSGMGGMGMPGMM